MKKTAIITFHNSYNCGSMLQAVALQEKLRELTNTEVEIIDFSNEGQQELYSIMAKPVSIKKIIKNVLCLSVYRKLVKQKNDFENFMNNFNLTKNHYTRTEELKSLDGVYDYYVCGSDQVWNIRCPDADDAYFLNFISEGTKIAYAPSFGGADIGIVADEPDKYRDYINQIKYLSIRERNGKKWLEKLVGRDVKIVLDPTLLFNEKQWMQYAYPERIIEGDYIFYYAFHYSKEQNKIVKSISKKLNMPVVTIDIKTWVLKGVFAYGVKLSPEYGPAAFLNLMANASLVLTRSFHGVAFSTIFQKKFWMLGKLTNPDGDDRAASILNQLGLVERMISLEEIRNGADILAPIDYDEVNKKLKALQIESENYIREAFGVDD